MKKIIALITIFVMTFTLGYAKTDNSINLNTYDILEANIFYINGQGYIKENGKLKKIEGIKFYSIGGERYIKQDGKITKVKEGKLYKINNKNFVKVNGYLVTLEKYLISNPIKKENKTFSSIFKLEKKDNIQLTYLNKYKINNYKSNSLDKIEKIIKEKYPKNLSSLELLKKNKFEFSFNLLINELENTDNEKKDETLLENNTENTEKKVVKADNNSTSEDEDLGELLGDLFKDL